MDSHSILDHDSGEVPVPGESQKTEPVGIASPPERSQGDVRFPGEDGGKSLAEMAERDLTATLQLLAERAQYITGASGAAIALRDHEEMVCRASAGSSAPEVGAQLQVNSGLSGESVRTRQTLRCDDAATDERVNRESCEALGIRSVVVMPLLRGDDVIGVFELFSDQANIFETRDLAALERMGAMVHTALEHSAAALGLAPPPTEETRPSLPVSGNGHAFEEASHAFAVAEDLLPSRPTRVATENPFSAIPALENGHETASPIDEPLVPSTSPGSSAGIAFHMRMPAREAESATPADAVTAAYPSPGEDAAETASDEGDILEVPIEIPSAAPVGRPSDGILEEEVEPPASSTAVEVNTQTPAPIARGPVANLRKCEACGFPVSEGRQLCLDCEKKSAREPASSKVIASTTPAPDPMSPPVPAIAAPTPAVADLPNFLGSDDPEASWLSTHKFMVVAMVVAVAAIVAVVLLR